jgi:type I restriction enzyme M protein
MTTQNLLKAMGFTPKENTVGIFQKRYFNHNNYCIEIDEEKEIINFGSKLHSTSRTVLSFSQAENWVVLECVNRLLEQGYAPKSIILEKTYPAGHGYSGRLDILVCQPKGKAYMMIECKTFGPEFDKAFKRMQKDGGQLMTYFQQDKQDVEVLMLYASELNGKGIIYRNEIIKIDPAYRETSNVKDCYERWNKLTKNNGIFEEEILPYQFKSKALTLKHLKEIRQEDSSFIFHAFLEILRHHVVSDKPNAFNKIFTLFLCKIYDEKSAKKGEELGFQWLEGIDDHISFQKRLTDLYKKGMKEFLDKDVTDISDAEFEKRYSNLKTEVKAQLLEQITEIRLKKNNEFAIKEVFDDTSFEENALVVKEVVELLQNFKIRYTKKHQYLSDFFEQLLTTGLKQESGQFFTPVPIAQFIIKSMPLQKIMAERFEEGQNHNLLPTVIDYAAGSGHFLTETMHEMQRIIDNTNPDDFADSTAKQIKKWQIDHFDWAFQYVYGIEKDYRLVKVGKVGCYLHGDGLARVIHSDGLGNFTNTKEYSGHLKNADKVFKKDNKQFDIVVSNPPYSVPAFKQPARRFYTEIDFDLYSSLTDQSSEIEVLFIERTKQLLKDDGIAGIILPSSILSGVGIYTKAREIILQYFEIIAIAELGANTFMATSTKTVTLFLRRRNNYDSQNIKAQVEKLVTTLQDITINGIEKPLSKYVAHVWKDIATNDYFSLLKGNPNSSITSHEIFAEYQKKLSGKTPEEKQKKLIERESEKLFYFILAYPQQLVLLKIGEKQEEKNFLGYDFSDRRGSEGIHSVQRGKNIDECTRLFDPEKFDNPEKASTYIHAAFLGNHTLPIHSTLQKYISRCHLIDMMSFDRVDFEKSLSLTLKKKVEICSKWEQKRFDSIAKIVRGVTYSKEDQSTSETKTIILTADNITLEGNFEINKKVFLSENFPIPASKKLCKNDIFICFSSGSKEHLGKVAFIEYDTNFFAGGFMGIIRVEGANEPKYIYQLLNTLLRQTVRDIGSGSNINNLSGVINEIKIPSPPLKIQQKIVGEIGVLEQKEKKLKKEVDELQKKIVEVFSTSTNRKYGQKPLSEICEMGAGKFVSAYDINAESKPGLYPCYGGNGLRGYTTTYTHEGNFPLIGRQGALCGNVCMAEGKFHATEHAVVATPAENTNYKWLYHLLLSLNLNQYATGTAQPGLSVQNLKPILVTNPPLSEQLKVVSQIETIEQKIKVLQNQIGAFNAQKEDVIRKYL